MIIDSPKSHSAKFVNHDLSVQLDSTNAFEGPEKLLEIWFAPSADMVPSANPLGLRSVDRSTWEAMLDIVKCKVLSTISTNHMDAFLLSESSMFVFPHKLILKTCGTTTTLFGIPRILEIAASAGFSKGSSSSVKPFRVFYSRKSFMFPEMQLHPHRSWDDEVEFLDSHFENGSSYLVGNIRSDNWHLYTTDPAYTEHLPLYIVDEASSSSLDTEDETLEILMTDLHQQAAAQFFTKRLPGAEKLNYDDDLCGMSDVESSSSIGGDSDAEDSTGGKGVEHDPGHDLGVLVTKHAGINSIYPSKNVATGEQIDQNIDSFGFTPCGYSCNALVGTEATERQAGGHYFTIHVTPEAGFSYASFETNIPASKVGTTNARVLQNVVNIFRPGKFSLTLFEGKKKNPVSYFENGQRRPSLLAKSSLFSISSVALDGYKRTDRILYEFDGYDMIFMSFKAV